MQTTTYSDFKKNVEKYINSVAENFETLIVNRGNDNGVVLMTLDQYNSMEATLLEMSSAKNMERLDSAIKNMNEGNTFEKKLIES